MKKNLSIRRFALLSVLFIFAFVLINACKKAAYTTATTEDVNITGYLEKYPDQFSLFTEIVKRSGTEGYLGAYGKYTLFAPTNTAVTAWLKDSGKASVADVPVEDLKNLVKFHLLGDTVATNNFTDGKLKQITFYGQYLQTGIVNDGAGSSYIINGLAKITKSNVRLGNGILHAIDHVLIPAIQSSAVAIEANSRYSIFTQALKETGFYDSLNVASAAQKDTLKRFQTVLLESDSALKVAGFNTYAQLKAKLSKTGNPKSHADSLWMYVAYHISGGASYTPDIIGSPAIYTLAPNEIITTKLKGQQILLNDDEFNGVLEPGIELNRGFSNRTTANGVLHDVKNFLNIKVRFQTPVYWDVTDQPEWKANPKYRGAVSTTIDAVANGASLLSGMILNRYTGQLPYYSYTTVPDSKRMYNGNDFLSVAMGTSTSRTQVLELRTPMLVKGKYKVWICYSQQSTYGPVCQIGMDVGRPGEQVLPNLVDFRQLLGSSGVTSTSAALPSADALMLTQGFKRYMATTTDYQGTLRGTIPNSGSNYDTMVGRLAGTVDIQTTDRHWIRFTSLGTNGGSASAMWLDMIHFIPVDADQNYPRFSISGTLFKRP